MSTVDRIRYTPSKEKKARDLKAWVRTGILSALLFLGSGDKEAQAQDNTGRQRISTELSENPQNTPFSLLTDTVKKAFSNRAEVYTSVPELSFSIDQLRDTLTQGINDSGITTVREIQVAPDQSSLTVILENGYQKMILTADVQRALADAQRLNETTVIDVFAIGSMRDRLTNDELQRTLENPIVPEYRPEEIMSPQELEERGLIIINLDPNVQLQIARSGFEEGGLLSNYNITRENKLIIVLNETITRHEGDTWMRGIPGQYSWIEMGIPSSVGRESALGYLNRYRNVVINRLDTYIDRYSKTGVVSENRYGNNLYTLQLSRQLFESYTIDELYSQFATDYPSLLSSMYPVPAAFALGEPNEMINSFGVVERTHVIFMQTKGQDFQERFQVLIDPNGTIFGSSLIDYNANSVASTPFNDLPQFPVEPVSQYPLNEGGSNKYSYAVPIGSKDFGFNFHHELGHALAYILSESEADRYARRVKESQYNQWQQSGDLLKSYPFIFIFGNKVHFVQEQQASNNL